MTFRIPLSIKIHFWGVECNDPEKVAYRFTLQKPTKKFEVIESRK